MSKKSSIYAVFIYAISAVIVILILYFGYRGITGFQKADQQSTMEKFQLRLKADMSQLSIRYGSIGYFSYPVAKGYTKMCFVDLTVAGNNITTRNNYILSNNYTLINDSVATTTKNAFILGDTFIAVDVGKMSINCSPFVYCINATKGKFTFLAEGEGDSVMIKNC